MSELLPGMHIGDMYFNGRRCYRPQSILQSYRCVSVGTGIQYDAIIEEMIIEITGAIPDAPFEVLISVGSTSNIDVTGDGSDMIILSNAGGAKSTDFKDALRLIRYYNTALLPTAGLRTVEVQFTT